MTKFNRIVSAVTFSLAILLAFLLIFQEKLSLPPIVQSMGRMHLLLLHLPIGILILICLLSILKNKSFHPSFSDVLATSLSVCSVFAFLAAIFGLFLSKEGGYESDTLLWHTRWGVVVAYLIYGLTYLDLEKTIFKIGLGLSLLATIIGTHLGATLTHGEGFIQQPLQANEKPSAIAFDEQASYFQNAIYPIFDSKCTSCHNSKKAKGGLDLSSIDKIKKGGKHGSIIDTTNLPASKILEYLHLPEDNKQHMPPQGKPQLSDVELQVLNRWILKGADFEKKWNELAPDDSLLVLASTLINKQAIVHKVYNFPAVSNTLINELNDPYTAVASLNINSPALRVDYFVRARYNPEKLKELQKVKLQLVELNMGNMPVNDDEIKNIIPFTNLEKLILNNSNLTDKSLPSILSLPHLSSLALSGTKITVDALSLLSQSKSLKEVFIWNTAIKPTDLDSTSRIHYYTGYQVDTSEMQALNLAQIRNESTILELNDSVRLYHRIPGVTIRYTINDSVPDSLVAAIYTHPIAINRHTTVQTRAYKNGWLKSGVATFSFFQKGIQPIAAQLLTAPNEKYRGEGAQLLINNVKGAVGNLIDGNWLGFRAVHMEALFSFDGNTPIHEILISINKSVNSYLVPPTSVEIFTGNDTTKLTLIKKILPPALTEKDKFVSKNETISIPMDALKTKYIKIKAMNNPKLPKWHRGKGEKGWLFVDEVFFY